MNSRFFDIQQDKYKVIEIISSYNSIYILEILFVFSRAIEALKLIQIWSKLKQRVREGLEIKKSASNFWKKIK